MRVSLFPFCLLAGGFLVASAFAGNGFSVARRYKKGDVHRYSERAALTTSGVAVTITGKEVETILGISPDGSVTMQHADSDTKISMSGREQAMPAEPVTTLTYPPNSVVAKIEKGNAAEATDYRIENLGVLADPGRKVSVGDKWNYTIKASANPAGVAVSLSYRLSGEEKVGSYSTLKIDFTATEQSKSPATASGTVWISKADGSTVKSLVNLKNMPLHGAPGPVTVKITEERV